jgi:putative ABC transport system ATP-binding protein
MLGQDRSRYRIADVREALETPFMTTNLAPTRTATAPLFALEGVGRTYTMGEVEVEVLRGVTLEIREGELLIVLGPSGSGKTTLMNLIGGLDRPSAGTIRFRGRDLNALGTRGLTEFRRDSLGFVFQFFNLIPNLTARENVQVAAELVARPRDADEVLGLVGLAERVDHFPSQLSGGEQQRVAIARALAKDPEILLCDEPTGALDYETGKRTLRVLREVNRDLGKTTVIVTHNQAIARMADRTIRMRSGEVVEMTHNPEPADPEEITW